jgi:hypothetical protein
VDPARPTQFPQLNAILAELAERAARILGANFAGAYLAFAEYAQARASS